ncbi:hypothetical protein DMENIID0001_136010 [Sergentomyia squamirostris]
MLEICGINRTLSQFVKNQPECPEQLNNDTDQKPANSDQSAGRISSKRKLSSSPVTTSAAPQKSLRTLKKPPNYNLSSERSSEADNVDSDTDSVDSEEFHEKIKKKRKRQSYNSTSGLELPAKILDTPPDDFTLPKGTRGSYDAVHLWSALMRITEGLSAYNAAKIYGIPRRSLIEYVRRYGITSRHPDPDPSENKV